jgi:hypothetical protein
MLSKVMHETCIFRTVKVIYLNSIIVEIAFLGKPVAFNLSNIQNESTKSHLH